jgi:hypothetical protein
MKGYRLVLCAEDPARDSSGYVHCRDDEHARQALASILERHPEYRLAMAYDGDRLALTLAREGPPEALRP